MNAAFERSRIAVLDAQRKSEARRETRLASSTHFEPPTRCAVNTFGDWIADNPDFKRSRAYNMLMDAYYESILHCVRE